MNALSLPPDFEARVMRDEPMSKHTSWHVGGPADLFFTPLDVTDVVGFLRSLKPGTPVMWIGLGSNLLVRDGGIRGAVIETHGVFDELERRGDNEVWCGSGVACAKLAKQCIKWGLGPGGVLRRHSRHARRRTGDERRRVRRRDVAARRRGRDDRSQRRASRARRRPTTPSAIATCRARSDEWFLGALLRFELRPGVSNDDIRSCSRSARRRSRFSEWSCGSVFTNPPGDHAARLIEACGLKGFRIGGARVSEMHANFIVNDGTATAADIEQLIRHVQQTVEQKQGVRLSTEVRIVGEVSHG